MLFRVIAEELHWDPRVRVQLIPGHVMSLDPGVAAELVKEGLLEPYELPEGYSTRVMRPGGSS